MISKSKIQYSSIYITLTLSLLCVYLISCNSEKPADDVLTVEFSQEQLKEDITYLITTLEKRHVNFYQRANKDSISQRQSQLIESLDKPMKRKEFFKHIGLLNPYFNDAHCLVFPRIEEADTEKKQGHQLFPFHVVLNERGELYAERDYERKSDNERIRKEWRIDSINGIAVQEVINRIALYSHGETNQLRRHMTTLLFADWVYTLFNWTGNFDLVFNGGSDRVHIASGDEWISLEKNVVQYNRLEYLGDVAWLRLNSFDVDEHTNEYEEFIAQSFEAIKVAKISRLIIDVRGNTGGQSDAGALVLQYLIDHPVSQVSRAFERLNEDNAGWFNYKGTVGTLREMNMSNDDMIKPLAPEKRFKGNVIVLSDEMTYSAGIIFITIVQDHKLATLVGRPTGGYANQTGNIEGFTLPHTKLVVYAPVRTFVRPNGDSSIHVVMPDVSLLKADSLYTGTDYILDHAIHLLKSTLKN